MSLVGQQIGNIRITELLGAGGMGEVYAGYDEKLQRRVAAKAVHERHRISADVKARFLQEARLLSQLDHPHICRIYDYVEHDEGALLILEHIDGKPLTGKLARGLDQASKLRIAEEIADALTAAHAEGVIHRDLKPDNVMITGEGAVKVLDFGLARSEGSQETLESRAAEEPHEVYEAGDSSSPQTEIGRILGSPIYMSPEQAIGDPVSTASDAYSFGLLLQELFTGESPLELGENVWQTLQRSAAGERQEVSGVDKAVVRLIDRLTAKAPALRSTAIEARGSIRWIRARRRRVLTRSSIAAVALVALSGSLYYTLDLRAAWSVSTSRLGGAEGLLGDQLDNLAPKLRELGRLDILEGPLQAVEEYYDQVDAETLSYEELSRKAQFLSQAGELQMELGNLEQAMEAFRASWVATNALSEKRDSDEVEGAELLRRSEALVNIGRIHMIEQDLETAGTVFGDALDLAKLLEERDGDDDSLFHLGQCEFWIGYTRFLEKELDPALEHFEAYLSASQELVERDPTRNDWQLEVAYGHSNLGSVFQARGDLESALTPLEGSLEVREHLVATDPENIPWRMDLGVAFNKVGDVLHDLGRLEDALAHFEEDLELRRGLAQHDRANADWQHLLATSHNFLGRLLLDLGRGGDALVQFQEQRRITEELLRQNPEHPRWIEELGISQYNCAMAQLSVGDAARALEDAVLSVRTLEAFAAQLESGEQLGFELAWASYVQAQVLAELGREQEALGLVDSTLGRLEAQRDEANPDSGLEELLAEGELSRGELLLRGGDQEQARTALGRARDRLRELTSPSSRIQFIDLLCRTELHLDEIAEARPAAERLWNSGYRRAEFVRLVEAKGLFE